MHWVDVKLERVISQHSIWETISYHLIDDLPLEKVDDISGVQVKPANGYTCKDLLECFSIIPVGISGPCDISANIYKQISKHIKSEMVIRQETMMSEIVALHTDLCTCMQLIHGQT